jgi:DNA-nicking Smr family endonuclease
MTTTDLAADISDLAGRTPPAMDRKAYRKLTRGKLRPEARIDLHGMTLAQAHPALTSFIMASHAAGRRLVLVITGKGSGADRSSGPIPERRGVLREQVPGWLAAPPCSSVVIQVAQAHQSHGGRGAYYVYLRRKT